MIDEVLDLIAERQANGLKDRVWIMVSRELRLLRVMYARMAEFKDAPPMEMKEIERLDLVNKTLVDYGSFIGHLNRLGRILVKGGLSTTVIPNYSRIYFFRNKTIKQ